jgi:enoyl-CoA hydratase/carnithine racemase
MSEAEVLFENLAPAGYITLNRPKALNALTRDMCLAIKAQLDAWRDDDEIQRVVIKAAGDRAFCAGGDIRSLYESGKAGTSYARDFYRDEYILNATIRHYPKPYIAMLRGIVMGGGVGVSVHGRYRVADESTVFAMPETGIGLFPDVGGSHFLPRMPGEIGMYLALTGTRLKTEDCIYAGVATHFVPAAKWGELGDLLLATFEDVTPLSELFAGLPEPVTRTLPSLVEHREKIDVYFAENSVEAILDVLDKDASDWARETAKTIRSKSPTAAKLAFRQIREGKNLDFDDCMRMEFRMVSRVVEGHDFYEGVRATIIDKDQLPKWQPARLEDVSDKDIDAYFAPLGDRELNL